MINAFLSSLAANDTVASLMRPSFEHGITYADLCDQTSYHGRPLFIKLTGYDAIIDEEKAAAAAADSLEWHKASCTVNGVRGYHPQFREAWTTHEKYPLDCPKLYHFCVANRLTKIDDDDVHGGYVALCERFKYDTGCFAAKHVDRLGDFTCLFFRKNQQCTGGELVLYDWYAPGGRIVFDPADLSEDVMVVFPTGMTHEVKPVTSGTRYVYTVGLARQTAAATAARAPLEFNSVLN